LGGTVESGRHTLFAIIHAMKELGPNLETIWRRMLLIKGTWVLAQCTCNTVQMCSTIFNVVSNLVEPRPNQFPQYSCISTSICPNFFTMFGTITIFTTISIVLNSS
jgi:hypothetical protein